MAWTHQNNWLVVRYMSDLFNLESSSAANCHQWRPCRLSSVSHTIKGNVISFGSVPTAHPLSRSFFWYGTKLHNLITLTGDNRYPCYLINCNQLHYDHFHVSNSISSTSLTLYWLKSEQIQARSPLVIDSCLFVIFNCFKLLEKWYHRNDTKICRLHVHEKRMNCYHGYIGVRSPSF